MGTADQMVKIHRLAMKNQKKTLIDKACKWLGECLSDNITYVPETFYGQPKPIISEKGLEDFIKYLEE